LGRAPYERSADGPRRNGSKIVRLKGIFSAFRLRRPVLRGKTPASPILEAFKRLGSGIVGLLASRFWLRGTATRAVAQEINDAFGTKLSASDVSKFTETILPDVQTWLNRPVPQEIRYLFIDALYIPVRRPGFTSKQALLVALGVTESGHRQVLGFLLGDKESLDSWSALLKDLLARGLNRDRLALVISDDHKAIRSAVDQVLGTAHQLCVVHKMRNALVRVGRQHRTAFYHDFTAVYWAESKDQALLALGRLQATWNKIYPKAVQTAAANAEHFLRFMDQPKSLWTSLRSTNIIERFNRELRRRLDSAGAMHSENELWKLVWAVGFEQEKRWEHRRVRGAKELALAA
jgi:transposase-like protein